MPRTIRMTLATLALACDLTTAVAAEVSPYLPPEVVPDTGIGIHYDGSGVVPDEKPPTDFDEKSGRNLRWVVPLPQWGMAGLVPVGNRVLHLADADARYIWPVLRCYDSATGALAWECELDPFTALPKVPAKERQEATAVVKRLWEDNRAAFRAMQPVVAGTAKLEQANQELASRGIKVEKYSSGYGTLRYVDYPAEYKTLKQNLLNNYNIQPNLSNQGISRTGDAFATPVSDGEHVYATTIHGHVTAVRMADGKVAWTRSLAEMDAPAYVEANHCMASSRLHKDVLLAFWGDTNGGKADVLVAMDKRSGKELWHVSITGGDSTLNGQWQSSGKASLGGRPGASPRILIFDGEAVALLGDGGFVRVRDGKQYTGGVPGNVQNYAIDHATNTIYGSTSTDRAACHFGARVSLVTDELRFEPIFLWLGSQFGSSWGSHGIFHDGRLFWAGLHVDPATGIPSIMKGKPADGNEFGKELKKVVRKGQDPLGFGRMFSAIANGHIYGMAIVKSDGSQHKSVKQQHHGVLIVTTLDGKRLSENVLVQDEGTPEHLLDQGWPAKDPWSYTAPMAIGNDCIYIASDQFLYCVGR